MKKEWKDHLGNIYRSKKDMCAIYGITCKTLDGRLSRGWSLKEALTTPQNDTSIVYQGQEYPSLRALCIVFDLSEKVMAYRIKNQGLSVEDAVKYYEFYDKKAKPVIYNGTEYESITALCKTVNANYKVAASRLLAGYTLEEALTEKLEYRKNGNFRAVTYKGTDYRSIRHLCNTLGLNEEAVRSRLKTGWSIQEAVSGIRKSEPFVFNEVKYISVKDCCKKQGVNYSNVMTKAKHNGISVQSAISEILESKCKNEVEYMGIKYPSLSSFISAHGLPYGKIRDYVKQGLTLEQAVKKVNSSVISYNGKEYSSLKEVYTDIACPMEYSTFAARINKKGLSIDEAADPYHYGKVIYKGKIYKSLIECCRKNGMSDGTVRARLKTGATLEDAMNPEYKPRGIPVIYKSKTYPSLTRLCKEKNLNEESVRGRLNAGMTIEDAIDIPFRDRSVQYKGHTYKTLLELCEKNGLDYSLINGRRKMGKSLEEAISMGNYSNNKTSVEYKGVTYGSLKECCKAVGASYKFVFARMANSGCTLAEAIEIPKRYYIGEIRVANALKTRGIKFYHDCTIKTILKELKIRVDWEDFLESFQKNMATSGYNWSKHKIARLRPDFVLFEDERGVTGVIEFDGAQHQNFVEFFFKTVEHFIRRSNADAAKQSLWEYLGIPMLRIRDDQVRKIEEMIDDFLAKPEFYIKNHNTYLSEEEYWAPLSNTLTDLNVAIA